MQCINPNSEFALSFSSCRITACRLQDRNSPMQRTPHARHTKPYKCISCTDPIRLQLMPNHANVRSHAEFSQAERRHTHAGSSATYKFILCIDPIRLQLMPSHASVTSHAEFSDAKGAILMQVIRPQSQALSTIDSEMGKATGHRQ